MHNRLYIICNICLLILSLMLMVGIYTYPFFLLDFETLRDITREDGPVEMAGALFFLLGSILMFYSHIKKSEVINDFKIIKFERNIFLLLLSVFFFLCFAEEVSWGQRFFGIETPDAIKNINVQKEINIHNIAIFHSTHSDYIIGHHALIRNFIYLYCVTLPIIYKNITFIRKYTDKIGLPVASLPVAVCFLLNELFNVFVWLHYPEKANYLVEIHESMWGYLFLFFSADYVLKKELS